MEKYPAQYDTNAGGRLLFCGIYVSTVAALIFEKPWGKNFANVPLQVSMLLPDQDGGGGFERITFSHVGWDGGRMTW